MSTTRQPRKKARIKAGFVLYVEGESRGEGEVVELPAGQFSQLEKQGHVEPTGPKR